MPQIVRAGSVGRTTSPVIKEVVTFPAAGSSGANVPQIVWAGRHSVTNLWGRDVLSDPGFVVKTLTGYTALLKC